MMEWLGQLRHLGQTVSSHWLMSFSAFPMALVEDEKKGDGVEL